MSPTLILALISAAVAGSAGFGLAWQLQGHAILKLQLEHKDERIQIQRNARLALERSLAQVSTAQASATIRANRTASERVTTDNALVGLRDTSAATVRAATESLSTCTATLATYDIIFGECTQRLTKVAGEADQCVSEVILLHDSWP